MPPIPPMPGIPPWHCNKLMTQDQIIAVIWLHHRHNFINQWGESSYPDPLRLRPRHQTRPRPSSGRSRSDNVQVRSLQLINTWDYFPDEKYFVFESYWKHGRPWASEPWFCPGGGVPSMVPPQPKQVQVLCTSKLILEKLFKKPSILIKPSQLPHQYPVLWPCTWRSLCQPQGVSR